MFEENIKIILKELYTYNNMSREEIIKNNIKNRLDKSFLSYVEDLSNTYNNLDFTLKTTMKEVAK